MNITTKTTVWAMMLTEAVNVLFDLRWMIVLVIALITADLWWGVSESRKNGVEIRFSRAGRRTCNKFVDYLTYLIIGALIGMAIFEPLDMATHTVTAAVALGLGCLFELDSIIGHVAAIHGSRWRFSLKRFVVAFVKKKNEDLGDAVEDALDEK